MLAGKFHSDEKHAFLPRAVVFQTAAAQTGFEKYRVCEPVPLQRGKEFGLRILTQQWNAVGGRVDKLFWVVIR
jgi:hypothetical protein